MLGDLWIWFKNLWCIHDYKDDAMLWQLPCPYTKRCRKCGRVK
jgi:hypothetical protein